METNKKIVVDPSYKGLSEKRLTERFYLQNHFRNYLQNSANYQSGSILYPDYRVHIMTQVAEYTKGLFSLPQMYCMFMANRQNGTGWSLQEINRLKINVLTYINLESMKGHKIGDIENFKRKIMELNPIIFIVLNDLICSSHLFWDVERKEFRYPRIEVQSDDLPLETI
jgi:hypothetical protein